MKRTVIVCDVCGREGTEDQSKGSWGILAITNKPTRDICPGCIARVAGWDPNRLPNIDPFPHARVG